jgi:hypothetical protein
MDSQAITTAKALAEDTSYARKYGVDETYWTHFLWHEGVEATSSDYRLAAELIEDVAPEATKFIAHLRAMESILS